MESSGPRPEQAELELRLGHTFERPELLAAALTHRSHSAEAGHPELAESQRMEFLGDAVLGAISAEWLVAHRRDWREGTLTKVRSRLTNAAALARVARKLRLGRGEERSGGREKGAVLADALEAVLGAVWLDGGPDPVRAAFAHWFSDEIAAALAAGGDDNPKGELQERMQREQKDSPRYELLEESGPPHGRHFKVAVAMGETRIGEGAGASKREAEMKAARHALEGLVPDAP